MIDYAGWEPRVKRLGLAESLEAYTCRLAEIAFVAGLRRVRQWWRVQGREFLGGAPPFAVNVCRACGGVGASVVPRCTACEGRGDFGRAEIVEDCTRQEWIDAGMPFRDREAEERAEPWQWDRACGEVLPPNRNRRAQRKARRLAAVRP
jgi:hypothetical protein